MIQIKIGLRGQLCPELLFFEKGTFLTKSGARNMSMGSG